MPPLSALYQESMLSHPYGYALYEPESSKTLQPGFCGYITELGQWTPLLGADHLPINLGDATSLARNGLTPFTHFQRAPSDSRSWGPKVSGRLKQKKLDLSAGASLLPAGIPADIGALYQYSNRDGFGAILMTQSPVVKDSLYGSTVFRLWCKANSETILRQWPDIKERGLIIVTSVYTTKFAMTNAWTESEKEVTIGFRAGAIEIGEIAPSSSWHTAEGDSGWVASEASQPDERKVVFFGGLHFKYRRLAAVLPQSHVFSASSIEKAKFRDADPEAREFTVVEKADEGDLYDVLVTAEEKGEMVEMQPAADEDDDDF
ncbi:uncharacterized protein ACLA_059630 [Aspergillus clavatus NRRL 1]|uniref:Uncharacterized protein n=1 Tax=Aspergillus clavatus (strain ATCC 1007 / CBS 513.65 / DSM 816 / NCTC 3887 / NRRL 1 / QM 1276 / 107) TaxID=344612 RepID=A1C4F6_ASPCL|nr:uncharacterized protein ACLA_059630 [Aspergillus clavatus NRRL 1]EAW15296.1 hypothetical protein ACLA_059630 [Aspergillus clavatus NRRL 1]